MNTIEILLAVRGLISHEPQWCQDTIALNADHRRVSFTHPRACRFSLDGAFYRVLHITRASCGPAYEHLKRTISKDGYISVANFNDARGTTHTLVISTLDRAIKSLGGHPPPLELD